jgi:hypothetical protein
MEEKFEKGVARGMDLGHEEGYTVAKEAFDRMVEVLKAREDPKKASTSDSGTQMDPPASYNTISVQVSAPLTSYSTSGTQTSPTTCIASPQSPTFSQNRKNAKIHYTSEISPNTAIFSSQTLSATALDPLEPSTSTTALKSRSATADSAEKREKVENSPIQVFTPTTPKLPSSTTSELTDDIPRVYTSSQTPNDVISHLITLPTVASSPLTPHLTEHQKSALSCADFESQPHTESPALTSIATALETHQLVPGFTKNHQKIEISPIFTQNHAEPTVSSRFSWADDASTLPIAPTSPQHPPRDLSCLRSTSEHPFSSLRRRHHGHPKKRRNTLQRRRSDWHSYPLDPYPALHCSSHPHTPFQARAPTSLDWDRDPRLADLSKALRALGWVQQ